MSPHWMSAREDIESNPSHIRWRGRTLPIVDARGSDDLDARVAAANLPGLAAPADRQLFVRELERSARRIAAQRRIGRAPGDDVRSPPFASGWSPLPAIAHWALARDFQEATWLAYLTTFFGPDERRGRELWYATRLLYGGFGERRVTWRDVSEDATFLPDLCHRHAAAYARLPRGSHRKNEPRFDVDHSRGLLASVASLVALAANHSGLAAWFRSTDAAAEKRFERLMVELAPLVSFGRTGTFDLLALLGNLGVYELTPARLYLVGATGPKDGGRRVLPGQRRLRALDDELSALARRLGVEIQAMEDALCNWQKS